MRAPIFWFVFYDDKLLLRAGKSGPEAVPCSDAPPCAVLDARHAAGMYRGLPCIACVAARPPGAGWTPVDLRASYEILNEPLYKLAGKGAELIHWDGSSRFCPVCGAATRPETAISKRCPKCGKELFPQVAAAVLVLVRKGESTLLVRAHNFRGPFYGLVAGFLETGESLEDCARREVLEETGLTVGAMTYFGSQPWPYPSGLMVGFACDWVEGELRVAVDELREAAFFTRDNLPELPPALSLTRRMIDWWRAGEPLE